MILLYSLSQLELGRAAICRLGDGVSRPIESSLIGLMLQTHRPPSEVLHLRPERNSKAETNDQLQAIQLLHWVHQHPRRLAIAPKCERRDSKYGKPQFCHSLQASLQERPKLDGLLRCDCSGSSSMFLATDQGRRVHFWLAQCC